MTARIGAPKTGGRVKGRSLDKGERQLVTSQMAGDLMAVYAKLGGVKWLLKFAQDNPAEFLRQGLSRLFPAPAKDDEPAGTYNQFNFNSQDTFEAARRVAFAINAGLAAQRELAPVAERVPDETDEYINPNQWTPPSDAPDMPEPTYDDRPLSQTDPSTAPARSGFIFDEKDVRPYDVQYQAWHLCRNTRDDTIASYQGCSGEQGGSAPVQRQPSVRKPTVAEIRRRQLL